MQAFLIDWGVSDAGHRRNLLQANVSTQNAFKDIGIGIATTAAGSKVGPHGDHPGLRQPAQRAGPGRRRRLLRQPAHRDRMQLGEGQGDVQIDATNLATGQTTSTQTWASGGYQIALAPGNYQVTASQNGTVIQTIAVTIGTDNVEQDFLVERPLGRPQPRRGHCLGDAEARCTDRGRSVALAPTPAPIVVAAVRPRPDPGPGRTGDSRTDRSSVL